MKRMAFLLPVLLAMSTALAEEPVYFADANLKAGVEKELGISDPTPTDMLSLTSLSAINAGSKGIVDLTGLEYAANLQFLYLSYNKITDISALSGLTNLTELKLYANRINDISPLAGLTNLEFLIVGANPISDISALSGLTSLTYLNLECNKVSNVSALAGLENLEWIILFNNQVSDVSALTGLMNLYYLDLFGNPLNHDSCNIYIPLIIENNPGIYIYFDACTEEQYTLTISSTIGGFVSNPGEGDFQYGSGAVIQINAVAEPNYYFVNWTGTAVNATKVVDPVSAETTVTIDADYTLRANFVKPPIYFADPNLKAAIEEELGSLNPGQSDMLVMTSLDASNKGIIDLTGLEYAVNLTYLQLSDNQISSIDTLSSLVNLTQLHLCNNHITDISPLSEFVNITYLDLADNPLNKAAYCVYLPLIKENNPGIDLSYDAAETFACDCDGDGFVDFYDFALLADYWSGVSCDQCEGAELDGDGDIDFDDFIILCQHWLQTWEYTGD